MAEEHRVTGDVDALLAAARVDATAEDLAGVRALFRRFAVGRERLRSLAVDLGVVEPLTIVASDATSQAAS